MCEVTSIFDLRALEKDDMPMPSQKALLGEKHPRTLALSASLGQALRAKDDTATTSGGGQERMPGMVHPVVVLAVLAFVVVDSSDRSRFLLLPLPLAFVSKATRCFISPSTSATTSCNAPTHSSLWLPTRIAVSATCNALVISILEVASLARSKDTVRLTNE